MKKIIIAVILFLTACNSRSAKVRYIDNGTVTFEPITKPYDVGDTIEVVHSVSSWQDVSRQAVIIKFVKQ